MELQLMTVSVKKASRVQMKQDYEFRQLFMVRVLSCFVLKLTRSLCNAAWRTDLCTGTCSAYCLQHNEHISLNCLYGQKKQTNKHTN